MAVTVSGLYTTNFLAMLKNTAAYDLSSDALKVAMFTNSITPNFDSDTAYSAYSANEVSGTGYSAGGIAIGSQTMVATSGSLVFDAADSTWATSTISSARCAAIYDTTIATNRLIALINFGSDYQTTAGTFTIQWNASGIFTIDLTP